MTFLKHSILILILGYCTAYPQLTTYQFEHFNIQDGLSNNSVNCVIQTADGYLWIATKDGLNRFDGNNFKVFKHNPNDSLSLPENYIMYLYESKDKTLWVGTWGRGLCKYNPTYESFEKLEKSSNSYIQFIDEDKEGNILVGSANNSLYYYNPKSSKIFYLKDKYKIPGKILDNNITSVIEDEKNNLWISSWTKGILRFNTQTKDYEIFQHNPGNKNSISNNAVWLLVKDNNNSMIICTDSGLDKIDLGTKKIISNPYIPKDRYRDFYGSIRQLTKDSKGKIWIGTYNYQGLYLLEKNDSNNLQLIHLRNEEDDPNSLLCDRIRWIYEDKIGNIWLGTEDGLGKLASTKSFTQHRYMPLRKNSLGGRVVSNIIEGKDNLLWIGYNGNGFDGYNLKTGIITHYKNDPNNRNSLFANDVITLYEDKEGILWIGTNDGGLNRFDKRTKSFKHYVFDPTNQYGIRTNWVQQILETHDGTFLIGTNDALQIFDREKEKFYPFKPVLSSNSIKFPDTVSINALYEDSKNNLWIGTWLNGLYRYDPDSKMLYNFLPDRKEYSITSNKITSIIEDSKGFIWLGTHSGGVNKFDKKENKFYHFTTLNGLPNDVVFGILEDEKDNLWISTMNGLVRYNPNTGNYRVYDKNDGIVNNQFNWHAYYKSKNGKMYFGGIDGFVSFNPDSITIDQNAPTVILTSFKVFDIETPLRHSLSTTKEIVLEHYQNFFSIEFIALDLFPESKHKYMYMLEGIDPVWVQAGNRTTAFYTDIKYGEYKFLVKAANADGYWGNPILLKIIIKPSWWNTLWFKIIAVLFLISAGFAIYKYRMNQLLQIERIRLNIASDLHDEVGSNLSSISVDSQSLISSNSITNTEKELSTNISKTAKVTIESFRDIIWFINPKNDLNENFIFRIKETAAKILSNINWDIFIQDDINLEIFNLEIRRNIFLLFKEAITNVIRHADANKCTIELLSDQKYFILRIKDNGKGFDIDNASENFGLINMKRRAGKIHADLLIKSEVNIGTTIELRIQLHDYREFLRSIKFLKKNRTNVV
ncbi:MAG: two-component regulator propeller domain-containing protein [Bacteroidota bacterium]